MLTKSDVTDFIHLFVTEKVGNAHTLIRTDWGSTRRGMIHYCDICDIECWSWVQDNGEITLSFRRYGHSVTHEYGYGTHVYFSQVDIGYECDVKYMDRDNVEPLRTATNSG